MKLDCNTVIAMLRTLTNSKYKIHDYIIVKPLNSIRIKLDENPDDLIIELDKVSGKIEVKLEELAPKEGTHSISVLWSDELTEDSIYRNCKLIVDYIEDVMDWGTTDINLYNY